ncbi:A24 family peptidase [Desulfothermobacter acidiphilus]|uniref:A24 family peptidase n=1 Tax=Desulfothermobacter acidiphilus TaxID=1938353 RepID=UPI003F88B719
MAVWSYLVWPLALLVAVTDLCWRRIPNFLLLSFLLLGLGFRFWEGNLASLLVGLQGLLVGFAILFPPYCRRWVGGGDLKLLATLGTLGGPLYAVYTFAAGALIGGVFSLCLLARHRRLQPVLRGVWWEHFLPGSMPWRTGITFPYGVCLALGGVVAVWCV